MANELLEPHYWSIKQVFDYSYEIPVYQRPYSWQADQIDSLLDDIFDSYQDYLGMDDEEKTSSGLYFGNIIIHNKRLGVFDIIDGQQRITSFALVVLALYAKALELGAKEDDRLVLKLQGALWSLDGEDKPIQSKRSVNLGSVEKSMLINVFDRAFASPKTLKKYVMQYDTNNAFEENIKENFLRIYDFFDEKTKNEDLEKQIKSILVIGNYILTKIYLIAIITKGSEINAFSIFESINSKGKKLEDIDLIKTYIFSKLDVADYSQYLNSWGELITKTNDDLYGYLRTYIRAYVKYYSQNISYSNFKKLDWDLQSHFGVENVGAAYKRLIDDMIDKVESYKALFDLNTLLSIVSDKKLKFYYLLFVRVGYEHPRPLFFRTLNDYVAGKVSKDDLVTIFVETIKSMVSFLTICQKDSKDMINAFSSIFSTIYAKGAVDKNVVLYRLNSKLQTAGIRLIDIAAALKQLDLYDKNKKLGAAVISVYESRMADGGIPLSWDEAYSKFSTYGSSYSLDHIMNQTPDVNDPNLHYFQLGNNLKLKEGHDFPTELVHDGMEYDTFKSLVLHIAGNLRLKGLDGNASRGNESDVSFCDYSSLKTRNDQIVEFVMEHFLNLERAPDGFNPDYDNKPTKTRLVGNFDFSMADLDLTGSKAKTLTIFDKSYDLSHNKDILKCVVMYFYEHEEAKILSLAENDWGNRRRTVISWDKSKLNAPFEIIKNKVYVETNLSSRDIIFYTRDLLNAFEFPLDLVYIYIPE